jgi:hypothetical protein
MSLYFLTYPRIYEPNHSSTRRVNVTCAAGVTFNGAQQLRVVEFESYTVEHHYCILCLTTFYQLLEFFCSEWTTEARL